MVGTVIIPAKKVKSLKKMNLNCHLGTCCYSKQDLKLWKVNVVQPAATSKFARILPYPALARKFSADYWTF